MIKRSVNDMSEKLLEMIDISKEFPGVKALDHVGFEIRSGEVVALAGANGAGKSTLLKIATGVYTKDAGIVKVMGKEVDFKKPADGKANKIASIYQELTVIPNLTVAENVFIGEIKKHPGINYKKYNERTQILLDELGVSFKAVDKVYKLSTANQQMVEIARAVNEESRVLIMDEPTSALTDAEKDHLFAIVKKLKAKGLGLVFVSHRLKEMFEICDRVFVMKDGQSVGNYDMKDVTENKLVELMLSRSLNNFYPKRIPRIGKEILKVEHLKSGTKVRDVSFDLREGEILGITGLLGSGRSETVRCIFGIDRIEEGTVCYFDKKQVFSNPIQAVKSGIGLVPEDRKRLGLVLNMPIGDNIVLGSSVVRWIRNHNEERKIENEYADRLNVKCVNTRQIVGYLSGGNQQKVIVAKWLLRDPKLLILDEPTKGIDVAAKAEIYKLINSVVENGTSVILISSELEEVMGVCDRAVVLYEGTTVGVVDKKDFSDSKLLSMSHNYM